MQNVAIFKVNVYLSIENIVNSMFGMRKSYCKTAKYGLTLQHKAKKISLRKEVEDGKLL